ncbi:hypothetical protein A2160_00020 [Candidatus Beckwithbacteria bacterium RBG_13_42_9]|uniref:Uncharacterized protein n=1 Tax=Candidatus Beckwithbacteria bacterium RBG_13_42_9 TaxID=1797457 RepID=A0A1F5E436_9BACT|nr:MAG: hypothetical protein A2160_00020 [Candidatus Beckwithbacteria bacterium RBG_13_42_9]
MNFTAAKQEAIIHLGKSGQVVFTLEALKFIKEEEFPQVTVTNYPVEPHIKRAPIQLKTVKSGWQVTCLDQPGYRHWRMVFSPKALIFPTREGEYISNPLKFPPYSTYSLSYPGTASTKCVIIFFPDNTGLLVGAKPSLNWAKISLTLGENGSFCLKFLQNQEDLFLIPFADDWEKAVKSFRKVAFGQEKVAKKPQILTEPRFSLQMGIRDFFGRSYINSFTELEPIINLYRDRLGPRNIVHLFATNAAGFDQLFPDFAIDSRLGGEKGLAKLVSQLHKQNLYVSHHFNPRIADFRWLEKNPQFKEAVIINPQGAYNSPWVEFYKGAVYFVLDPNHPLVQEYSLKTIKYFQKMGFDYVEIDQIAYQRNLYTRAGGFGSGYQRLIDQTAKMGMKFWIEGVSDIFDLPADCFCQVLQRDRPEMWETEENRRGYVYGTAFTRFFRCLQPFTPISFQLVTEKCKVDLIAKRMKTAQNLKANVYDLELGFVDKTYIARLNKVLQAVKK